jgi:hypothetical protein
LRRLLLLALGKGFSIDEIASALLSLSRKAGLSAGELEPYLRARKLTLSADRRVSVALTGAPIGLALELERQSRRLGWPLSEEQRAKAALCEALAEAMKSEVYALVPSLPPEPWVLALAGDMGMPLKLREGAPVPPREGLLLFALIAKAYLPISGALKILAYELRDWGSEGALYAALAEEAPELPAEQMEVLETSVDDVSPAQLSHVVERLLAEGAYDAQVFPYLGKKGRLGSSLRVLAPAGLGSKLADLLLREGLTLGARLYGVTWIRAPRQLLRLRLSTPWGRKSVRVKVAYDREGRLLRARPEHDDIAKICRSTGEAYERVRQVLEALALKKLSGSAFKPVRAK